MSESSKYSIKYKENFSPNEASITGEKSASTWSSGNRSENKSVATMSSDSKRILTRRNEKNNEKPRHNSRVDSGIEVAQAEVVDINEVVKSARSEKQSEKSPRSTRQRPSTLFSKDQPPPFIQRASTPPMRTSNNSPDFTQQYVCFQIGLK